MKALVCEMCSGNDFAKVDGMFVCQNCGTKYSTEEAKKLMIEGTVDVKVDRTEETKKYLELARRAFNSSDYESAGRYYQLVLEDVPNSWEASFYSVLCRAVCCKIKDIASSCRLVNNSLSNVFLVIKDNTNGEEQVQAVTMVAQSAVKFAEIMFDSARNHYNEISSDIRLSYRGEASERITEAVNVMLKVGSGIRKTFAGKPAEKACVFGYKKASQCQRYSYPANIRLPLSEEELLQIFDKFDPEYAEKLRKKMSSDQESLVLGGWALFIIGLIIAICCVMFVDNKIISWSIAFGGGVLALWGLYTAIKNKKKK